MARVAVIDEISIDESKLEHFRTSLLKKRPMPVDDNSDPTMTDKQWLKHLTINFLMKLYNGGIDLAALEQGEAQTDLLE